MLIGLMTDFGEQDQYVFQMKSVINRINPSATVYDITHQIPKFDIWQGSFILCQAVRFLPDGSIIVAVVDPGVATERKAIAVRTKSCILIGPDNGLLYQASVNCGIREIRQIESEKVILKRGSTFDGRDVFSPAAANLSLGFRFDELGRKLAKMEKFTFPEPNYRKDRIEACILHLDSFGNAITNLPGDIFREWAGKDKRFYIRVGNSEWSAEFATSYYSMKEFGLIEGSTGYIEISSYQRGAPPELKRGESLTILKA